MSQGEQTGSIDPFFHLDGNTEWNAYVGRQSDEELYVDGFMDAAMELASAVIDRRLLGKRDTLVMPILFNVRHAVELSLKHALAVLHRCRILPTAPARNHDIAAHWRRLSDLDVPDEWLRIVIAGLEPYVLSLAAIDDDGQSLRYPERRDGQQSLADRSLANIGVIRDTLTKLQPLLKDLKFRTLDFEVERNNGVFTPRLSRHDLFQITKRLPQRQDWGGPEFTAAKAAIMEHYRLSNRQFSEGLKAIKRHRQMGPALGLEFTLGYLTDAHALEIVSAWLEVNPPQLPQPARLIMAGSITLAMVLEDNEQERALVQRAIKTMSIDELADLKTIYNFGRGPGRFVEVYEDELEATRRQWALDDKLVEHVHYPLSKSNFAHALIEGVKQLGHPHLAGQLEALRAAALPMPLA